MGLQHIVLLQTRRVKPIKEPTDRLLLDFVRDVGVKPAICELRAWA